MTHITLLHSMHRIECCIAYAKTHAIHWQMIIYNTSPLAVPSIESYPMFVTNLLQHTFNVVLTY